MISLSDRVVSLSDIIEKVIIEKVIIDKTKVSSHRVIIEKRNNKVIIITESYH